MAFGQDFEEENGNGCKENGIHTVKFVRLGSKTTRSGSKQISLTVDDGGKFPVTFYAFINGDIAPSYLKANGEDSWLKKRIINPLAYLLGATDDTVAPEAVTTKNGESMMDTFIGFPKGATFKIAVQNQWNEYSSKYTPVVIGVYSESGLSASEKVNGITVPEQIKRNMNIENGPKGKGETKTKTSSPEVDLDEDDFGI